MMPAKIHSCYFFNLRAGAAHFEACASLFYFCFEQSNGSHQTGPEESFRFVNWVSGPMDTFSPSY